VFFLHGSDCTCLACHAFYRFIEIQVGSLPPVTVKKKKVQG
jgi:hypothetical protein